MTTGQFQVTAAASRGAGSPAGAPPAVPGFIVSAFPPLVHDVVRRCLGDPDAFETRRPPGQPVGRGDRIGIVLGTIFGDSATSDAICRHLVNGRVHNPLLFFQSVPTAILGQLCQEYAITGPITCIAGRGATLPGELLTEAGALLDDDLADEVLLIGVELAPNARVEQARREVVASADDLVPHADTATALLLGRPATGPAESYRRLDHSAFDGWTESAAHSPYGWQDRMAGVCRKLEPVTAAGGDIDRWSRP